MLLSDKQQEYIVDANHRLNFKRGARRCGKSYLDYLYIIPQSIVERKGLAGLNFIFGVSKSTIERNVLQPMRELYGKDLVGYINNKNIAIIFNEEVHCLGCEKVSQVSKIQGTSAKFVYGDEVAKWNKEVFYMILGSLDKPYSIFHGSLNPESNSHWLKKEFLDVRDEKNLDIYEQHYTIFDNPFLPKEFVDSLCKEYAGTVYYDRLILGEWKNAEGLIYKTFANNKSEHIVNEYPKDLFKVIIGVDFGGNGSKTAFVCSGVSRNYETLFILKSERVMENTSPTELEKRFIKFAKECQETFKLPLEIRCDSAEQILIAGIKNAVIRSGLRASVFNAFKKPINDRIMFLIKLFGLKKVKIYKDCKSVIDALEEASYVNDSSDERLDNGTTDIDTIDALEYSFEPVMKQFNDMLYFKRK